MMRVPTLDLRNKVPGCYEHQSTLIEVIREESMKNMVPNSKKNSGTDTQTCN